MLFLTFRTRQQNLVIGTAIRVVASALFLIGGIAFWYGKGHAEDKEDRDIRSADQVELVHH